MGMPWPKTHYHAHLELQDKGRAIVQGLVVCLLLLNLIPRVFGQKKNDLARHSYPRSGTAASPV